jgi:hypothetical protein
MTKIQEAMMTRLNFFFLLFLFLFLTLPSHKKLIRSDQLRL